MPDAVAPLILDLVEWVAKSPRPYHEVMEAWRTSCPRLPVWEDTVERGYVECKPSRNDVLVMATAGGRQLLAAHGRLPPEATMPRREPAL
ncbi:MAG: hypothetical protein AB7E70_15880 [Hyphomicrobiaceae bacterium]